MTYPIQTSAMTLELKDFIFDNFSRHAMQKVGYDGFTTDLTAFVIHNAEQKIIATCVVQTFWGTLHVPYIMVAEEYRGQGIGQQLMEHAMAYGREHQCSFVFLETLDFQGVDFYLKLGFTLEFQRAGYAQGVSFCYLKKDL